MLKSLQDSFVSMKGYPRISKILEGWNRKVVRHHKLQ